MKEKTKKNHEQECDDDEKTGWMRALRFVSVLMSQWKNRLNDITE